MTNVADIKWTTKNNEELAIYILLDRSGSMANKQQESVPAVNRYIRELDKDTIVTVVAFDNQNPFEVVRDHIKVSNFVNIDVDEVYARGMTPLNDAAGQLIDRIFLDAPKRAVLVVQTDGEENFSREYTYASVCALLDRMKTKGYEVVFLGSEFRDINKVSGSFNIAPSATMNQTRGMYNSVADSLAMKTKAYAATGQNMIWTASEKTQLGDDTGPTSTVSNTTNSGSSKSE